MKLKKLTALALAAAVAVSLAACGGQGESRTGETLIRLSDSGVTVDGSAASESADSAVYLSHDIVYYEDRDSYDSGNAYGEGTAADRHTAEEAAAHTVVNITKAGTYRLSGQLSAGQIAVDLGEEAESDPTAVVTLVFDGADVTCTVAPAVIFYRVYECDTAWTAYDAGESSDYTASATQDTSAAGARVVIADDTVNNIKGSYVARIYKDQSEQKKRHKYDGAFYSRMSMEISGGETGTGVLNIEAENEGLDSELHLTVNGGVINIRSGDDGINTNEDGVSVTTINGGVVNIVAGLGSEGDGIDSNGYLVINGGTVLASANPAADSGLDSDCGSYINGGTVIAAGSTMDWPESDSRQVTINLQFAAAQGADEAILVTDADGGVLFAYDPDRNELLSDLGRSYRGAVISCPAFAVGESYHIYVGGDITGSEQYGLYDAATVTAAEGGVQQQYTGTDVGGFGGGTPPERPNDGRLDDGGTPPEAPDGNRPDDGGTPPEAPDGNRPDDGGTPPEAPDRNRPDDSGTPPQKPDGQPDAGQPGGAGSTEFYMNDKVNSFSGVSDAAGQETVSGEIRV